MVAAMCVGLALYHLDDPQLLLAQLAVACFAGLIAAGMELAVRFELRLIESGFVADAIVDGHTPTRDRVRVDYHYITEAGRTIEGATTISRFDTTLWPIGRRIPIIYAADRPRRHKIEERVWFVEWEIGESL